MEQIPIKILVAEDDLEMLELMDRVLRDEGYNVILAKNGLEALGFLETEDFDLVLSDLKMPGATGIDILKKVRQLFLYQPVILMTAFGSVESAVHAMKEGAYSYITKPFDLDDLLMLLSEVSNQIRLSKYSGYESDSANGKTNSSIVFRSMAFKNILQLVEDVAATPTTVLITGESGVGKELIASEVHLKSQRSDKPFVALDINTVAESLMESELFGHVKGSFTGAVKDKAGIIEVAQGGTLFLDEIGDLPLSIQVKLLRFFQEKTIKRVGDTAIKDVDVRLVTATNCDLGELVKEGKFREDLYYRISVVNIHVPPLRDRREDIGPLAYHFLNKFNTENRIEGFRPETLDALIDFDWPGNVRQLENAIEHSVIRRKKGMIHTSDLPDWFENKDSSAVTSNRSLEVIEKDHILRLLNECEGNQSRAARILGIDRRTLSRKLKKYGMSVS